MKKGELVASIAERYQVTKDEALSILDFIFAEILNAAAVGDSYNHPGFGKFVVSARDPRVIHNVTTGKKTKIPKKRTLKLVPSRRLNKKLSS